MSGRGASANSANTPRNQAVAAQRMAGVTHIGPDAQRRLDTLLGRPVSPQLARDMVGAPREAGVLVSLGHGDTVRWQVTGPPMARFDPNGNAGMSAYKIDRTLLTDPHNPARLIMLNDEFFVHKEVAKQGLGSSVFAREVATLTRLGVAEIHTFAARSGNAVDGYRQNGFFTWALLGYNPNISSREGSSLRQTPTVGSPLTRDHAAAERAYATYGQQHTAQAYALTPLSLGEKARLVTRALTGRLTLHDLMATPHGQQWWYYHGSAMGMAFDLTPGSASHRTLDAYMAERRARGRPTPTA